MTMSPLVNGLHKKKPITFFEGFSMDLYAIAQFCC